MSAKKATVLIGSLIVGAGSVAAGMTIYKSYKWQNKEDYFAGYLKKKSTNSIMSFALTSRNTFNTGTLKVELGATQFNLGKKCNDRYIVDVTQPNSIVVGLLRGIRSDHVVSEVEKRLLTSVYTDQQFDTNPKTDIETAIRRSFVKVQKDINETLDEKYIKHDGATALLALIRGNTITVANLGNSRCVRCHRYFTSHLTATSESPELMVKAMSRDHTPNEEKNRIEKCGGLVTYNEIGSKRLRYGNFPVSRAFGASFYSNCGVISEPEIIKDVIRDSPIGRLFDFKKLGFLKSEEKEGKTFQEPIFDHKKIIAKDKEEEKRIGYIVENRRKMENILIIASNKFWNVISSQQVCWAVNNILDSQLKQCNNNKNQTEENEIDMGTVSRILLNWAYDECLEENMTVIALRLTKPKELLRNGEE